MNFHQPLLGATVLALSVFAFAQSTPPTNRPATPQDKAAPDAKAMHLVVPADKLKGLNVTNDSDKKLADLRDVLVDPSTGELRYAVLSVGGILGVGDDHVVVPWAFVQISENEKDADKLVARTNLTEAQLKNAPQCKDGQVLDVELDRRIESAFGKDEAWAFTGKGKPTFAWLSEMDGVLVKDPAAKDVGKVQELIVAPQNGCVAYAVIDTTKEAGDKDVAVPWARLQYAFDRENKLTATTPVDVAHFQGAPEYDVKDWKRMSSTAWMTELGTHYGCDPFWKSTRFATAHKLPATQRP